MLLEQRKIQSLLKTPEHTEEQNERQDGQKEKVRCIIGISARTYHVFGCCRCGSV